MYVWIPAESEAVVKVREWQAKEKCWQRDDFILFGISCLGRRAASWQRKETRLNAKPHPAGCSLPTPRRIKPARTFLPITAECRLIRLHVI